MREFRLGDGQLDRLLPVVGVAAVVELPPNVMWCTSSKSLRTPFSSRISMATVLTTTHVSSSQDAPFAVTVAS